MEKQKQELAKSSDLYAQPSYNMANYLQPKLFDNSDKFDGLKGLKAKVEQKSVDHIQNIILKITDKILAIAPSVLKKIFNWTLENLGDDYSDGYGDGYGYNSYGNNEISNTNYGVFKHFGLLGFFPMIILKIVNILTYLFNTLKKNKFLKNFVVPGVVLLLAAGGIFFLTWFLQQEDFETQNISFNSPPNSPNIAYNNPPQQNYEAPVYYPPKSYNSGPVYSRSYFENKRFS